jgi:hypothetical protein
MKLERDPRSSDQRGNHRVMGFSIAIGTILSALVGLLFGDVLFIETSG